MILAYYGVYWDRLVFHYLPIFLIGVFVFQYRARIIGWRELLGLIAVMIVVMHRLSGWLVLLVAIPTALLIAFSSFENRTADRVGDVSYSLYLVHLPIGVSVIGCLSHWLPYAGGYIGVLDVIGVAASMWVAWLMYLFIEKPSQELSSAIKFARRSAKPHTEPAIAAAGD